MRIRWNNIIALGFLVVAGVLISRHGNDMAGFLNNMTRTGPGYSPNDQMRGFVAFGLVGVLIVAIVRIVISGQRDGKDE